MTTRQSTDPAGIMIRPLTSTAEAERCAALMASSEPWCTLGRTAAAALELISDPLREVYLAEDGDGFAGFVILCVVGPFTGYIQSICLVPGRRGHGIGTRLVAFAEARIAEVSPNVFLCVSSFNDGARRLYERLGYEYVGELRDYLISGASELLYRKTRGPWATWTTPMLSFRSTPPRITP